MNNESVNKREFAANVEGLMKKPLGEDVSTNRSQFDFDNYLKEFLASQSAPVPPNAPSASAAMMPDDTSGGLRPAEEQAALSGKFNPDDLFGNGHDEKQKQFVLSRLAPHCIIEAISNVQWMLQQKRRIEVLKDLQEKNVLADALKRQLPQTDVFGLMLRRVLREGDSIPLHQLNAAELAAMICVLETIESLQISKPDIEQCRMLAPNSLVADLSLLTQNFIGRTKELERLFNFLAEATPPAYYRDWRGLIMSGLGGVGKSTLLAKFTEEILQKDLASIVLLDFDRPGIHPRDTAWLERELSQQIGEQFRHRQQQLKKRRRSAFQYEQEQYGLESSSESARFSKSLLHEVREMVTQEKGGKPFLLILDTVEEVSQRSLTPALYEWVDQLAEILYPVSLKVIWSGRLYEEQLEEILQIPNIDSTPLDIVAFDKAIAEKFLLQQGLAGENVVKIIESAKVPLRPLELKLISKLLLDGSVSMKDLENDLDEGAAGGTIDELFMGLIYRRILKRIKDEPIVSKIACPGLILRYITADLIQFILQPALELGEMDAPRAQAILDKLRSYTWLAYEKSGKIWHRKDLRRSMLRVMIAKEGPCVEKIRKAAIEYFSAQDTPEARAEVVYHRLMNVRSTEDGNDFELDQLRNAYEHIQQDIPDLPKAAAVLLEFAANDNIDESDVMLLPNRYFVGAYDKVGKRLVSNRQFDKALELFQKGKSLNMSLAPVDFGVFGNWEKELLFATASWEALKKLPAYQAFDKRNITLSGITPYVFPSGVIEPADVEPELLENLLKNALDEDVVIEKTISGAESISILTRLCYSLSNLESNRRLSDKSHRYIPRILDVLYGNRLPLLEKSLFILSRLCYGEFPVDFRPGISVIRIDKSWISRMTAFVPDSFHGMINSTASVFDTVDWRPLSAVGLLSHLDANAEKMQWRDMSISIERMDSDLVYDLVKGPDPLFRDPCRYAILEAVVTDEDYRKLAGIIQSVITIPLWDLKPDVFARTMASNTAQTLEAFIEVIDRSWALGDFLRAAQKAFPGSYKLLNVKNVYERWEATLDEIFLKKK